MILAGDIGGTKTHLAYFDIRNGRLVPVVAEKFPSHRFATLDEIILQFVSKQREQIGHACLSIAGPVINQRCQTTNLPWIVDGDQLSRKLDLPTVWLINDLEANARGITELAPDDLVVLNTGNSKLEGNQAIISAGTGLGEAGLYWNGHKHIPFASEGGHADFAPMDAQQIELLQYLMKKHEHVSYELVLSGIGLHNIYLFLRDSGRHKEPDWLATEMAENDPGATISRAALEKKSELCEEALDTFVAIYGAEAGNLALKFLSVGGLFIGGGIAPKIIDKLKEPMFLKMFFDKGRMRPLLETIPVRVVMNDKTALLGAARCAVSQLCE